MPLHEKVRIEVYLPDSRLPPYDDLLQAFDEEFTYAFGGCSTIHGLRGSYLSKSGQIQRDHVNLIYTDIPLSWPKEAKLVSQYVERVRQAAFDALNEETVLVAVMQVQHSDEQQ